MDQWIAIGAFLLGAGSGALLTWIARTGLSARRDSAGDQHAPERTCSEASIDRALARIRN